MGSLSKRGATQLIGKSLLLGLFAGLLLGLVHTSVSKGLLFGAVFLVASLIVRGGQEIVEHRRLEGDG